MKRSAVVATASGTATRSPPKRSRNEQGATRTGRSSGKAATLTQLPYHVLLDIFLLAAQRNFLHDWPDCAFLLNLATTCRAFFDPAIAALYRNPLTEPPQRAHQLLSTLKAKPELRKKIKHLVFEIDPLLRLATPGYGHFDLAECVRLCPGLKELWLGHSVDQEPYRWTVEPSWKYPPMLFDALEGLPVDQEQAEKSEPTRLKSWRWNGWFTRYLEADDLLRIHFQTSFQSLKRLSIIYVTGRTTEFLSTLSVLPNLEALELECCDAYPESLTSLSIAAPGLRLKSLSFINCHELDANALSVLLVSNLLSKLEHLRVSSCRACNLEFLPTLVNTPNLKSLTFDGKLFSPSSSYKDMNPHYDSLIPLSVTPVYPPALQSLKLLNLRKWSAAEAEAFLDNLIAAAPTLPHIRELSLYCILDGFGWRERAGVRDRYEPRLLHAFVRPASGSITIRSSPAPDRGKNPEGSPLRRSSRALGKEKADSDVPSLALPSESVYRGTCEPDKVDIKMDNARPAEVHFDEEDFLDNGGSVFARSRGRSSARGRTRKRSSNQQGPRKAARGGSSSRPKSTRRVQSAGTTRTSTVVDADDDSETEDDSADSDYVE